MRHRHIQAVLTPYDSGANKLASLYCSFATLYSMLKPSNCHQDSSGPLVFLHRLVQRNES